MAVSCKQILKAMNKLAPERLAEEWDYIGLIVGDPEELVSKISNYPRCDGEVVSEAVENGVQLILSHHPPFLKSLKQICYDLA